MLAERLLTAVMRRANNALPGARALRAIDSLPAPVAGPRVPALRARAVLRAALPVLLVQPLPVLRGARDALLQAPARRDAHGRRPGLRLRVDVRRAAARPRSSSTSCARRSTSPELFSIHEVSSETNPNHLVSRSGSTRSSTACERFSVGVQSFDDSLLKQMDRYDKYGSAEEILERLQSVAGALPLAQRGHDLQLPEPDRRDARPRRRAAQEHRRQPDDVLPAHGLAGGARVAASAPWARSTTPARPLLPADRRGAVATRSSPRARGRSRAPAAA